MTWVIDLDELCALPDCTICHQQICTDYLTCKGELRALVERVRTRHITELELERRNQRGSA